MRFAGSLTGACVTVSMAWWNFGPVSLAAGSLAATVANASLATLLRPASFPWLPGFAGVRRVVSFGGKVSLTNVINTMGASVPELVLGKVQGMAPVGLYSRANGLAGMFQRLVLDATQAVAMPLFSKASRDGHSLTPIFMKATSYVTVVGWSFFGVLIVLAQPIMRVLYGDQWDASVPLTRFIAAAMAIGLPTVFCSATMMASGAMERLIRITLWTALQNAALVATGAALGLKELGWAIVLAAVIAMGLWLSMSPVMRQVSRVGFGKMLLHSGCVAAAVMAASTAAFLWTGDGAALQPVRLAIGTMAGALAFTAAVFWLKHPLREELHRLHKLLRQGQMEAKVSD
jgi:O-antigen/teichoic acid export membrane protein